MTLDNDIQRMIAAVNDAATQEYNIRRAVLADQRQKAEALPDDYPDKAAILEWLQMEQDDANAERTEQRHRDNRPVVDELPHDGRSVLLLGHDGRDELPAQSLEAWKPAIQHNSALLDRLTADHAITQYDAFVLWVWGWWELAKAGPKGHTVPDADHTKHKRNPAILAREARAKGDDPDWQHILGTDIQKVRNLNARRLTRDVMRALAKIDAAGYGEQLRNLIDF